MIFCSRASLLQLAGSKLVVSSSLCEVTALLVRFFAGATAAVGGGGGNGDDLKEHTRNELQQ